MKLSMSIACDENNCIGRDGQIPWQEPYDLARFYRNTLGKAVIMGRKTWVNLPTNLPNRKTIVMASNVNAHTTSTIANFATGFTPDAVVTSKAGAIEVAKRLSVREAVVIGGKQIFDLFIDDVNTVYFTRIHKQVIAGDTFWHMPHYGQDFISEPLPAVDENHTESSFSVLERKTQLMPEL